jgi:hypothetical protein
MRKLDCPPTIRTEIHVSFQKPTLAIPITRPTFNQAWDTDCSSATEEKFAPSRRRAAPGLRRGRVHQAEVAAFEAAVFSRHGIKTYT